MYFHEYLFPRITHFDENTGSLLDSSSFLALIAWVLKYNSESVS